MKTLNQPQKRVQRRKARKPDTATMALLDAWAKEAAALTPEERAEAKAEGDAFLAGLNQNRVEEGREPVFPAGMGECPAR
jgi:hypothetical protein